MKTLRQSPIFLKVLPLIVLVFILLMSMPFFVEAQTGITLPANFTSNLVVGGIHSPTTMQFAPDGRLFVLQQQGAVRIIKNGALLATPFLVLSNVDSSSERGLLGIAFDPNFASNHFLYVYYTTNTPAPTHNRISRFTANCPTNCDVAVSGSELVLMDLDTPSFDNPWHNGGTMSFGIDGKLYIGTGETHFSENAQTLNNRLGKILRINSNGTIPSDNPFFSTATGSNRAVWAMGLRNPYVFAFQPGTGRMFINDVGQDNYEEINDGIAGENYGWPCREGNINGPNTGLCSGVTLTSPLYAYPHPNSGGTVTGCAITGGAFYNPTTVQFPASYVGKYFFADYCGSWIKVFNISPATASNFASNTHNSVVDLKVSSSGELYYLSGGSTSDGSVYRIYYSGGSTAPSITQHPANITVAVGNTAQFICAASGTTPLSYQWQKNNQNIPGATSSTYVTPDTTLGDNGAKFRCRVTNSFGTATSNNAILTVLPEQPPTATITTPAAGTLYSGGETINFSGTGTDLEDGTLAPGAFSWDVKLHHNSTGPHVHNITSFTGATGGSFVVSPTLHGDASENIFYRITLTVTDSDGLTDTASVDVDPRVVTINIRSNPSGLEIVIDNVEVVTPLNAQWVVGVTRVLDAASPQVKNGKIYAFSSWSDGGASNHSITTPDTNTTYTATYVEGLPVPNQFEVTSPPLTWNSVPWALAYHVQVDDDPTFNSPEFDDNDIPPGMLTVSPPLSDGKQYWWRVRARRDDQTWGPWSAVNTFTIDVP